MIYFILTIFISMFTSALCSLFEASLLSISHNEIAELSLKKPKTAAIWINFKKNIQKPIAVILIINTIAHTLGASLSGAQFDKLFGNKGIVIYSFIFSFAMIQWTEILPKTLGVKYNTKIAHIMAVPLLIMTRIFTPVVKLIELLNLPFVGKKTGQEKMDIINEISVLSRFAFNNSLITQDQEKIITRTVNLADVKARDVMIPFKDIKFLNVKMSMQAALIEAHIHNHTRFPLINTENTDKTKHTIEVLGYINFKDIVSALQINPQNPSLAGIVRPVVTIYEDETYPDIFKKITSKHQHIAVVKDRNNILKGLLTLEDLIEEIVGEIEDEYDILPVHLYPITNTRFIAGGGVKITGLNQDCGCNLPDADLNLSEWFIKHFGAEHKSGSRYEKFGAAFTIKKIRRGKISEIIIEKSLY